MSHFEPAIADVLQHEGGYVNHEADGGGATNLGISLRFLSGLPAAVGDLNGDGHVTAADIQGLSRDQAKALYKRYFWDHYRLAAIREQAVAVKLFNFFVNMRGKTAALIAQRAANQLGATLVEDGILGPASFAALNQFPAYQLLPCIKCQAWAVYQAIIDHNPSQAVFRNGWRKRAFAPVLVSARKMGHFGD